LLLLQTLAHLAVVELDLLVDVVGSPTEVTEVLVGAGSVDAMLVLYSHLLILFIPIVDGLVPETLVGVLVFLLMDLTKKKKYQTKLLFIK
jgi:hypothetical protein